MESCVLALTQPPHPWRPPTTTRYNYSTIQNPLPTCSHLLLLRSPSTSLVTRYRRWDSNAETIRSKTFGFNFRGNQDDDDDDDEEEEEEDYEYNGKKKRRWWSDEPSEILEDAIDTVWIFKVFRSYGWAFPFIIISLLVSTGPKAFLMALALPLGQSVVSLAFEKLWGRTQTRPKRKSRMRRKATTRTGGNVKMDEKESYAEDQETSNKKKDYQSWVVGNDVSVDNTGQDASSFGGWDDLERMESAKWRSRRRPTGKGKLTRRERNGDTPLLLRLLIAVFPFLGSWTKMFW